MGRDVASPRESLGNAASPREGPRRDARLRSLRDAASPRERPRRDVASLRESLGNAASPRERPRREPNAREPNARESVLLAAERSRRARRPRELSALGDTDGQPAPDT